MDLMQRRRELMGMQTVGLPGEYQMVEYMRGKMALIDLGYVPKVNPHVVCSYLITDGTDKDIMGFQTNAEPSFIIDPAVSAWRWYNRFWATEAYSLDTTMLVKDVKQTWEFGNIVKYNGTELKQVYIVLPDWSSNTQSFCLFGARNEHKDIQFYDFALYDGDQLVRSLIPCKRKSDDIPGMYDTVTKTFFVQSKGTLIAGPEIRKEHHHA